MTINRYAKVAVLGALLATAGCDHAPTVQDARDALDKLLRLDRAIRAACSEPPTLSDEDRAACRELIEAFYQLHGAP